MKTSVTIIIFCIAMALFHLGIWAYGRKQPNEESASGKTRVYRVNGKVNIPKEEIVGAETDLDGNKYICLFNTSILKVKPKKAFRWFLSLAIAYKGRVGEKMPTQWETVIIQDFCDLLDENLKGNNKQLPNAVFLGRLTGNGQTQAMWYINNPDVANEYLQNLISSEEYPLDFNFEMYEDPNWKEAEYWLKPLQKKK